MADWRPIDMDYLSAGYMCLCPKLHPTTHFNITAMKGRNQALYGFSGSIENMTAVRAADGDTILKGKITSMTNPNTEGQQAQRTKFSATQALASAIVAFLRSYFIPSNVLHSAYNSFMQWALNNGNGGDPFTALAFYKTLRFTQGGLYNVIFSNASGSPQAPAGGIVEFDLSWTYDSESEIQDGTDTVRALVFDPVTYDWQDMDLSAIRSAEAATILLPTPSTNGTIVVPYFLNAAGTNVSTQKARFFVTSTGVITSL